MRHLALAAMLALLTGAAGCASSSSAAGGADASKLAIGATAEPQTLDLTTTPDAAITQALLGNVYEGLVALDENGAVQPRLATSWDVSPDRKVYTFHLRPGVKFSDGRALTADDVVFSFDRVIAPGSKHPHKAAFAPVQKVTAKDPATVEVRLKTPSNGWLFSLTGGVGAILDKDAVANLATKPVGTGPFTFGTWTRGSAITLDRNDAYWGAKAKVKQATFRYYTDPNALNNALLAGDVDVISNVQAPQSLAQFKDPARFQIINGTTNGEVVLALNNGRGPLKDKRVRQAVNYAIDRAALVKTAWAGYGTLIGSMVPPTDPWYEDLANRYPYDPAKAKALVAEAGATGAELQLKLPTLPYATAAGQFVAAQLQQAGLKVKTTQLEFPGRWLDTVYTKGDYDLSIVAHVEPRDIVKYGDPSYYWHYDNPAVKALLARADEGTPEQQTAALKQVARTLSDDAASDWLFLLPNLQVVAKGVTGLPKNAVSQGYELARVGKS
ncbi:ABC transporter substrate-binding protein [Actinomadura macrotermitis]|uniref:HTH-type transcriptional regulator SgrR n=1 Tax=Actinomadura macrotermitis TaxID=2585200 RepID=A0A7K0BNC3_9ACTN|nr:ABC transporter substrate-binding protein [Actinomadura macrotermitis]MQY02689.1 HTH-type transcriptional regulator SgrR [Actinomadura macrotermitis]